MTLKELKDRIDRYYAEGHGNSIVTVTISPSHGGSCANDDRQFDLDDISQIGSSLFLTSFDHDWVPN